jgi:hypothetical protein
MGIVALSKIKHSDKALSRHRDYSFAKNDLVVPICDFETIRMASTIPLLFMRGRTSIQLYGLLGLQTGKNLFIKPDGSWAGKFTPSILTCHPFSLGQLGDETATILFDEDSEFVVDREHGYPFFQEDGSLGAVIEHYRKVLPHIAQSIKLVQEACSQIDSFDLLEPFRHNIQKKDGSILKLEGLLSINKQAFAKLEERKFLELRQTCAFFLIYAHLFSQTYFHSLMDLMNADLSVSSDLRELGLNIFEEKETDLNFNFS